MQSNASSQKAANRAVFDSYVRMIRRFGKESIAEKVKIEPKKIDDFTYDELAQMLSWIKKDEV